MMLRVPAGLAALESRAGRSSRAGALYEGAQQWQGDNVPLLHARAQELRRQGNQEVRVLSQASRSSTNPFSLCVLFYSLIPVFLYSTKLKRHRQGVQKTSHQTYTSDFSC